MANLYSKEVIENRKWALQAAAAMARNAPSLGVVLDTADRIYNWAAVVPPKGQSSGK